MVTVLDEKEKNLGASEAIVQAEIGADGQVVVDVSMTNEGQEAAELEIALADTPDDDAFVADGVPSPQVAEVLKPVVEQESVSNKKASNAKKSTTKRKPFSNETALRIVHSALKDANDYGLAKLVPTEPYSAALEMADKVEIVFGVQTSYLWAVLEAFADAAAKNLERVLKDENSKAYLAKNVWMSRAIEIAKIKLQKEHNTLLPEVGNVFKPQSFSRKEREEVENLIGDLQVVSKLATCKNDGKPVKFHAGTGKPFEVCFDCSGKKPKPSSSPAQRKTDKQSRPVGYEISESGSKPVTAEELEAWVAANAGEGVTVELKNRKPVKNEVSVTDTDTEADMVPRKKKVGNVPSKWERKQAAAEEANADLEL